MRYLGLLNRRFWIAISLVLAIFWIAQDEVSWLSHRMLRTRIDRSHEVIPVAVGHQLALDLPNIDALRSEPRRDYQPMQFAPVRCLDCPVEAAMTVRTAERRLAPENRVGIDGIDLFSGNFSWHQDLLTLRGRATSSLTIGVTYNSSVWIRDSSNLHFDPDRGSPAPGFTLSIPKLEGPFVDRRRGLDFYIFTGSRGERTTLVRGAGGAPYESTDGTLLALRRDIRGTTTVLGPEGSGHKFVSVNGRYLWVRSIDANGNSVTGQYGSANNLQHITDTVGRVVAFSYDAEGRLSAISETAGARALPIATFGYELTTLSEPGHGHKRHAVLLTSLGIRDGSLYRFIYTDYGQIQRIEEHAPDGHLKRRYNRMLWIG